MENTFQKFGFSCLAYSLFFHSIVAMDAPLADEDPRIKCPVESVKPVFQKWVAVCDQISGYANRNIIPLLALKSRIGNSNARELTEEETQALVTWQSLQDTINQINSEGLKLVTSVAFGWEEQNSPNKYKSCQTHSFDLPQSDINIGSSKSRISFSPNYLKYYYIHRGYYSGYYNIHLEDATGIQLEFEDDQKAPEVFFQKIKKFESQISQALTSQFYLILTPLLERYKHSEYHRANSYGENARSQEQIKVDILIEFCQQKVLDLTFKSTGIEAQRRCIAMQMNILENTPNSQEILNQLTFKSCSIDLDLSDAKAQIDLAKSTLDILQNLYYPQLLRFTFIEMFMAAEPVRDYYRNIMITQAQKP